jgi:hypothetical protein
MSARRTTRRWILRLVTAGATVLVVLLAWATCFRGERFPLPPSSPSRYLNTGPEARYIGTAACARCHDDKYQSYLLTAHSRALAEVDPKAEPADGSFEHRPSGRSYRVYRQGEQLRHEEVLRTAEGKEIARTDLPVRYRIGSGNFSRSYLIEVDGFLHESPITWYPSKQQWALSPGYDRPQHEGFDRPVTNGCLACHAGRFEMVGGTVHRVLFHDQAIGCESCHGPGSLHQDLRRSGRHASGGDDPTIVHPGKLPRSLQIDICAACHLRSDATVSLRGRTEGAFRPGTPLSDYRVHYRFDTGKEQMTVVGHVEQMRASACYQKSEELTCLTCHDPHRPAAPKDKTAFYRQKCLSCHAGHPCGLDPAERLKKSPRDDCVACHMPRGDTDIPHFAFTHHRIGLHTAPTAPAPGRGFRLIPLEEDSHLSALDRQRNLGLANLGLWLEPGDAAEQRETFRLRARELLEGVHAAGLREGETSQALATLTWDLDPLRAANYAREALAATDTPPHGRAAALAILALRDLQKHNFKAAAASLEQVVLLRRNPDDWGPLGISYLEQNQPQKALTALQKALAIRPSHPTTHAALARAYRQLGDLPQAQEHQDKASWLFLQDQK